MKLKLFSFLLLLVALFAHAQGETNIWYFGKNAGLDFNNGSPVALNNGMIDTQEGCSTISNAAGQLLFYTDGVTVFNRNHLVMANGTGLTGHSSSAQSAIIVQMPGSTNQYYIFTTDNEHDPNGFRYSVLDMSLDSGNGAVTAVKNILVYTPTTEGFGITKHANGIDYWIITHEWLSNNFRIFRLTPTGLNTTPIITSIGLPITGSQTSYSAAGMIKASPSGSKIVLTSVSDFAQLFDFNNFTGVLSNPITLVEEIGELMGIAFSPNESLVYISNSFNKIYQFNLNATDIPNSKLTINSQTNFIPSQMQIGVDNKIYIAVYNAAKLAVINNPNVLGLGCNFSLNGPNLGGKTSRGGLPSFNESFFFSPSILFNNSCVNQSANFQFSTNQTVISASWNFGDGSTSSSLNPSHTYTLPGEYTVSLNFTTASGGGSNSRVITIFPQPTLLQNTIDLKQCDDNNDGFTAFNLNEVQNNLVASTSGLTFTYHNSQDDADSGMNPILNTMSYANIIVSNDVVFVRVKNANNCFKTAQINLNVSTTSIPISFQQNFTVCDNAISGSATDGIATFNFSSANQAILNLYPSGQLLNITYYKNLADALSEQNNIVDIYNFTNVGYPNSMNIYVRVDSQINNECLGLGHHITLKVEAIPFINGRTIRACDDNQDGILAFDTTNLQNSILNGLSNVAVTYTAQNGAILPSPLPVSFVTTSQNVTVRATNLSTSACFDEAIVSFIVDDLPIAFPIPTSLTTVCDDEINPMIQDGLYAFDTSSFQNTIIGNQTNKIVKYFDANGLQLSTPLPNPFSTGSQIISAEVINANNILCKASILIPFIVKKTPKIALTGTELICSNNPTFTKTINAGLQDLTIINDLSYQWYFNGTVISTATNYELIVNTAGIYTVEVKNSDNCVKTRTIMVTASNIATIENVAITDLTDNNSVIITVSGAGSYEYSLDGQNYQSNNTFVNVDPGFYTVYVKDEFNCGIAKKDISLMGIPKFFTPNGDGFNDYWNIKGTNSTYNSKALVSIFDRFGKLLTKLSPLSKGWDGTYNGQNMPASDYWYVIELEDSRVFRDHFTLKR